MARKSKLEDELNEFALIDKMNKLAGQIVRVSKQFGKEPAEIAEKAGKYAQYIVNKKEGKR